MKRRIPAILVLALCLGLCGCAMGDGYGKYANIYQLLDAGDYAGAHAAIDALAGIVPATSPATVPATEAAVPPATVPTTQDITVPTEVPTEPATVPVGSLPNTTEPALTAPAEMSYVLNTSSMKFHKPSCGSVETIKESNRENTSLSRDELIAQGYEPCGRCKP